MGKAGNWLEFRQRFRCAESVLNWVQKQLEVWKFEKLEVWLKVVACLWILKSTGSTWLTGVWGSVVLLRRTIRLWRRCVGQRSGRGLNGRGIWQTKKSAGSGGRLNGKRLDGRPGFFANQKLERFVVCVLNRDDQADFSTPPLQLFLTREIGAKREVSSSGTHPKSGWNAEGLSWAVFVEELRDVLQDVHTCGNASCLTPSRVLPVRMAMALSMVTSRETSAL